MSTEAIIGWDRIEKAARAKRTPEFTPSTLEAHFLALADRLHNEGDSTAGVVHGKIHDEQGVQKGEFFDILWNGFRVEDGFIARGTGVTFLEGEESPAYYFASEMGYYSGGFEVLFGEEYTLGTPTERIELLRGASLQVKDYRDGNTHGEWDVSGMHVTWEQIR